MRTGSVELGSKKEQKSRSSLNSLCFAMIFFFLLKFLIARNKGQILYQVKKLKTELLKEIPYHLTSKMRYSNDLTWETVFSVFFPCMQ